MAIMISAPMPSFVRTQTMAKEIDEFGFLKHYPVWQ